MCKYSNNEEPYMKHWRYILLTSLTMLLWGGRGFAQQRIYGSVADHVDGEYLPSVSVSLLQRDSVKIQSTVTNERGRYSFDSPGKGSYILQFTSLGYKGACKDLVVSVPKRITEVDAGLMRLKREATLLGEVKVTATKIKMFQRGDTVVYNADAFSLAEGSMLQALVSQLPGVTLNDDGRIYVNGRFVSSLLLNGRDFFKGNPLVALENLPAYTVKTVKVYDKAGEATRLLGRDAGDKALVMDVNLKREYNEGYIANADMGCGSSDRYKAQLFGLRFTHLSRLALFGNLNNVNSNKQPGRQGDWKGDDTPTGRQKTVAVGGEYSYENRSHNVGFSLTPTFSRLKTDNQAWTSGQTYLDNALLFTRGQTANLERPAALSTKGKLWTRKKKWSGELYAEAQYEKKSVESLARSASFMNHPHASTEILDSIVAGTASLAGVYNYLNNSLTGNGENYKLTLGQTMRMKVGGDLLSADAEYSYTKECHNTHSLYQLATYHSDASHNQRTFGATNNHMYQLKANLRYQMFLSGKFNDFLLFRYGFSEDALRSANPFSASPYQPSGATQGGPTPPDSLRLDQANSYSLSEHHYKHTLEARFRYSWKVGGQLLALSVAVPVVWHHDLLDELRGVRYHLALNKVFVDPEVVVSADKFAPGLMQTAIVGFNLSHAMHQLPDMVPFEDTRLPHRVVRGNAQLGNIQKGQGLRIVLQANEQTPEPLRLEHRVLQHTGRTNQRPVLQHRKRHTDPPTPQHLWQLEGQPHDRRWARHRLERPPATEQQGGSGVAPHHRTEQHRRPPTEPQPHQQPQPQGGGAAHLRHQFRNQGGALRQRNHRPRGVGNPRVRPLHRGLLCGGLQRGGAPAAPHAVGHRHPHAWQLRLQRHPNAQERARLERTPHQEPHERPPATHARRLRPSAPDKQQALHHQRPRPSGAEHQRHTALRHDARSLQDQ